MSLMPIFMVGIVFGLAMDYEVFLVTRVREATSTESGPTGDRVGAQAQCPGGGRRRAHHDRCVLRVHRGWRAPDQDDRVRMAAAVPARRVRRPDGDRARRPGPARERAWWMPRWLHKVLPRIDVEGQTLAREPATAAQPDDVDQEPVPVR